MKFVVLLNTTMKLIFVINLKIKLMLIDEKIINIK